MLLSAERGRANARMTKPAFAILVIFLGAFVALFVFEGVLLIPGAILVYLFLDSLFPRRYLAVTNLGLVACSTKVWSDRPKALIAAAPHEAVFAPAAAHGSAKVIKVPVGSETITLRRAQYDCLTEVLHRAPPNAMSGTAHVQSSTGLLPTRRENAMVVGVVILAVVGGVVAAQFRTTNSTSPSVAASMSGWMASYGSNYTTVAHDFSKVAEDTNQVPPGGSAEVRADCVKLGADAGIGASYPPMPDSALGSLWSSILNDSRNSAQSCQSYLDQPTQASEAQFLGNLRATSAKYSELLKAAQNAS